MTGLRAWVLGLAVAALAGAGAVLAGCGDAPSAQQAVQAECAADKNACVEVGVGRPIYLGTLLFEADSAGLDSKRAAELAVDYLDGAFDSRQGELLGHPVSLLAESEDCTPKGGVAGARRLLLEPDLVAVIGTTCSAAAFDAAAKVLSAKDVLLMSPSNTSPLLTDPKTHERFYFRTAFNDLIQGAAVAAFVKEKLGATTAGVSGAAGWPPAHQPGGAAARDARCGGLQGDVRHPHLRAQRRLRAGGPHLGVQGARVAAGAPGRAAGVQPIVHAGRGDRLGLTRGARGPDGPLQNAAASRGGRGAADTVPPPWARRVAGTFPTGPTCRHALPCCSRRCRTSGSSPVPRWW